MAGNREGGLKARDKNLAVDPDFYKKIGSKGGATPHVSRPFQKGGELARRAGAIGGRISRRRPRDAVIEGA